MGINLAPRRGWGGQRTPEQAELAFARYLFDFQSVAARLRILE